MATTLKQQAQRIVDFACRPRTRVIAQVIAYAYVVVAVVVGAVMPYMSFFTARNIKQRSIDEVAADHDYRNPLYQLAHHPHFRDTMVWWTHNWIGEYRNWRPLASQFFWVEYKLFGPYRFDKFSAVAVAMHLLALVMMAWFVRELTGSRAIAWLSVLLFAGSGYVPPLGFYHGLLQSQFIPPAQVCLGKWKDTVDFWYCACLFASSALALKGRWGPSIVLAFMSPCFKETGWMVFPVNLALVWLQGRVRQIPPWAWVGTIAAVALLVTFRILAGTNIMGAYSAGHNNAWQTRYFDAVAGAYIKIFAIRPDVALLGTALVAIGVAPRMRLIYRFVAVIVAVAVCAGMCAVLLKQDMASAIAGYLDITTQLSNLLACMLWAYGFYALAMDRSLRRYAPMIILFRLVAAGTLVITLAIGAHVLYLSEAYGAIIAALIVASIVRRWLSAGKAWLTVDEVAETRQLVAVQ